MTLKNSIGVIGTHSYRLLRDAKLVDNMALAALYVGREAATT